MCGNGFVDTGEQCDPVAGDGACPAGFGCDATCGCSLVVPSVALLSPPDRTVFQEGVIEVAGTAQDALSVECAGTATTPSATGAFTATVALREGSNVISCTAFGAGDARATASRQFIRDATPPLAVIDFPAPGSSLEAGAITVTGRVNDITTGATGESDVTLVVNGNPTTVSNGTFAASGVALQPGANPIVVTATDTAGNQATTQVTVLRTAPAAQKLVITAGNDQSAAVGSVLTEPLTVALADSNGNPLADRPVDFQITANNGHFANQTAPVRQLRALSDATGLARATLVLGTTAGTANNRVEASAPGFPNTVVFRASGLASPADFVRPITGDNQSGAVGQLLPEPFVVVVQDAGGNPVANQPVEFAVESGGGSFEGSATLQQLSDSDGRASARLRLGPDPGSANHLVRVALAGGSGGSAAFQASARIPGPAGQTRLSGVVLDNAGVPVPGATVSIDLTALETTTGTDGSFELAGVPVGSITFAVDGATTTRAGTFPSLHFSLTTVSGRNNSVGMPIHLPEIAVADGLLVGGAEDVVLTMSGVPGLELRVFANSVTCPDGSPQCLAYISQVHNDKVPMPPVGGIAPRLVWTVQPTGMLFDPPAQISYPNIEGLLPGTEVQIVSFDHDLNEFVDIGNGSVREDGAIITSAPGVGLRKAGWGYPAPPPPDENCYAGTQNPCEECTCIDTNGNGRPDTKQCQPKPDGASCDDENVCTEPDRCENGACVPGPGCDEIAAECQHGICGTRDILDANGDVIGTEEGCLVQDDPLDAACEDGDLCTDADTCDGSGVCLAGAPRVCDDGNVCTDDFCDSAKGCDQTPILQSLECDDGDPNTRGDRCREGTCQGTDPCAGVVCDPTFDGGDEECHFERRCDRDLGRCVGHGHFPGKTCTVDTTNEPGTCNQEGFCRATNKCLGENGLPLACPAAPPCHQEGVCDPGDGVCKYEPAPELEGTTCGDGPGVCSGQDTCDAAGTCQPNHVPKGELCGDGPTECSLQDTCDGEGVCQANHEPDFFTVCGDGLTECGARTCSNGECELTPKPGIACVENVQGSDLTSGEWLRQIEDCRVSIIEGTNDLSCINDVPRCDEEGICRAPTFDCSSITCPDDGNPCTREACSPAARGCTSEPDPSADPGPGPNGECRACADGKIVAASQVLNAQAAAFLASRLDSGTCTNSSNPNFSKTGECLVAGFGCSTDADCGSGGSCKQGECQRAGGVSKTESGSMVRDTDSGYQACIGEIGELLGRITCTFPESFGCAPGTTCSVRPGDVFGDCQGRCTQNSQCPSGFCDVKSGSCKNSGDASSEQIDILTACGNSEGSQTLQMICKEDCFAPGL